MKTIKLHILDIGNRGLVEQAQRKYSNAFMLLYKKIDECADNVFIARLKERFDLTDIGYRSLLADVKAAKNQDMANDNERIQLVKRLKEQLYKCNSWEKPCIQRKIQEISKRIGKERTFGGLLLLRQISSECNKETPDFGKLARLREEYRKKRVKPLFVTGEANQNGNRFFDVTELWKGKCVYKPKRGEHCEIEFKVANRKDLELISKRAKEKTIPVTVSLTTEYICISYDEQALNGFGINEVQRRKDVNAVKQLRLGKDLEKEHINEVYKRHYADQHRRMMEGKLEKRCIAVDLNPDNIGWSVLDKTDKDGCRVLSCGQYEYKWLCRKLGKASDSVEQKHLNNKRKHELKHIVKNLFKTAEHYKCSMFVMEDLSFDGEGKKLAKETNRKNRNIWCRKLITELITRRCNESGIVLEVVNACYSSFIGNIQHGFVDATNASIEIGRRGLHKYENGAFMPDTHERDISTLEAKFGKDAKFMDGRGWAKMYNVLTNTFKPKEFAYRLRATIDMVETHYQSFSMDSCRSHVNTIIFI